MLSQFSGAQINFENVEPDRLRHWRRHHGCLVIPGNPGTLKVAEV
jgi:hypothetical protein